jgi:hypothetical protein
MLERDISYDSYRPLLGKGVTLPLEPNVTRYGVMTAENTARSIRNLPMPIAEGLMVPVPTVSSEDKLKLEPVVYEVRDEGDYLSTYYGDIPVGGIVHRTFKSLESKALHSHLEVLGRIGTDGQDILKQIIRNEAPSDRSEKINKLRQFLPKISFHEDKGILFNIAEERALTLTPHGAVINHDFDDEGEFTYNFHEYTHNEKPLEYEDGFFFEYALHQTEAPIIDNTGAERTIYMIAGVKFPRSVDFNYINTYIKTYIENGGKLTDTLIRDELMNPYFDIFLK